jgi:hypothetical protein
LGWQVLGGFTVFESAARAGEYISRAHWWNANERGLWIDATPRRHAQLVLVESDKTPVPPPSDDEVARFERLRAAAVSAAVPETRKDPKYAAKLARKEALEAEKTAKSMAQLAKMEHKRQLAALPDGPYQKLLKAVGMLEAEILVRQTFDFSSKTLRAADMEALAGLCTHHAPVATSALYVQNNLIGDDGLAAIAAGFKAMPQLEALALQSNHISSRGIVALCRSPPVGKLKTLYLWNNDICDEGIDAMTSAVRTGRLRVELIVVHTNRYCTRAACERLKDECKVQGYDASI